ncbi:uncharacterized protein LOC116552502 [Sapajus apella]|uniref:Uncharacterized protein LOC116552502 n=1 Tax=Sapajus apella TaxID=9515 RepID=A0A6J3HYQ9_SAPAP|nr:uncharacterized protein LOC116552502 [Sapajus apella]
MSLTASVHWCVSKTYASLGLSAPAPTARNTCKLRSRSRGTPAPASRDRSRLCLPRPLQTPALRCACALSIAGLLSLLLPPEGVLGEELPMPQPRAASWLNLDSIKKYVGKLFNKSPKKSKNHKKTANATTTSLPKATKPPPWIATNPQWLNTSKPRPPTSSRGPR